MAEKLTENEGDRKIVEADMVSIHSEDSIDEDTSVNWHEKFGQIGTSKKQTMGKKKIVSNKIIKDKWTA